MTQLLAATNGMFRTRELFIHDGSKLRRVRVSALGQGAMFALFLGLVAWASFATVRLLVGNGDGDPAVAKGVYSAEVAKLAAETERRVIEIEQRQLALAEALADEDIDAASLKRLGFLPGKATDGVGGPFESVGNPTFKALFNSWKKLDQLQDGVIAIPSDKPIKTDVAFTSGFGVRSDPFKSSAAMHPSIDLAGPVGTQIQATADGVVLRAGWNSGGYGNLVEIDHGRGITTRYGHLSAIDVRAGDKIHRGQLIGRMGSTGRSTGSHLHYEVRIDGRAVNPIPFMKSTDYVLAMKQRNDTHSMDAVALGGPAKANR